MSEAMKLHLKLIFCAMICISGHCHTMVIDPQQNFFNQLPSHVTHKIAYYVLIDRFRHRIETKQETEEYDNAINSPIYQQLQPYQTVTNEGDALELINQGYDYQGCSSPTQTINNVQFNLQKRVIIKPYTTALLAYNHHEIFYCHSHTTQGIRIFHKNLEPQSPSFVSLNRHLWPDSFEFVDYNELLHMVGIRWMSLPGHQPRIQLIPIATPHPKNSNMLLRDFFHVYCVRKQAQ